MEHSDSSTLRWRRGLLALCAIGFIFWAFSMFQASTWWGLVGLDHTTTSVPFHDVMLAVNPGSPAAKAGIKAGDVADLRTASPTDRWGFRNGLAADGSYTYVFLRGATQQRITLRSERTPIDLSSWSWYVGALGALIFATIIAWRRPWLVGARLLCLLLITVVIETCLAPNNFITPWGALDFGAAIAEVAIAELVVFLLVAYTLLFGRPLSTLRKALATLIFLVLGFDLLYNLAADAGIWSGAFDVFGGPIGTSALLNVWEPLAVSALPVLAIATAVAAARARERSLLVWTTAALFLSLFSGAVGIIAGNIPALASNGALFDVLRYIENGAQFLTPFAIGYALLNRRLLDIGFVLNHAAVFSVVSIVVITAFILVEWALSGWLSTASHATNLLVAGGLALVLGLSMRHIHGRVDNVVDRAFFSKRRRDQDAIAAFSREAAYITDRNVLLERTEETLLKHADASSIAILLDDRRGRYGEVSENDPAVLALRAKHDVLDLHGVESDIRGDYAFPMVSRGRVLGVLALGPERSGEHYAPDELEVILRLAHGVGAALDVLAHDGANDPVLEQLSAIRETLAAICETQRAMYESLVARPEAIGER